MIEDVIPAASRNKLQTLFSVPAGESTKTPARLFVASKGRDGPYQGLDEGEERNQPAERVLDALASASLMNPSVGIL